MVTLHQIVWLSIEDKKTNSSEYTRVIQWIRWIVPKKLAIGITVYGCTFFKEINSYGFFHVLEHGQHDLLWSEYFFISESQCASSPESFFSTQAYSSKYMFSSFIKIFWLKHTHHTLSSKIHMVCTCQPVKIKWQTSVQAWSTVWFAIILNSLKTNIFLR